MHTIATDDQSGGDHRVKIRGFPVDLADIEASIRQGSGVRDAVVLKNESVPGDGRLVAYVVQMEHDRPALAEEIRSALKKRLPEYMVPAAIVRLQQLPLNPNGGIDREALLRMETGTDRPQSGSDSPQGQIEQEVTTIFADSLKLEEVGMDEDFFDLGGDSLKAVIVVANVANRLGTPVPVETLFEARTLRKFCQIIRSLPH